MHISDARYRNLKFFFTNGLELNQRTGQILTAGSNSHGKAFKKRVEHKLTRFPARNDKNGTKIEPVVAMFKTLLSVMSPVVAVVPTAERALTLLEKLSARNTLAIQLDRLTLQDDRKKQDDRKTRTTDERVLCSDCCEQTHNGKCKS